MRILLVEDDTPLAEVTWRGLTRSGLAVDVAADGGEALDKLGYQDYEVVVLDRDLPVVHGDDVCASIVATVPSTRVLMLTAAGETTDLVDGLALGADDYLRKPFEMAELVARVRALGRRSPRSTPPELRWRELCLDVARRRCWLGPREVQLTRKEFGVLETLLAADGRVVSAEELLERVWDERVDPFTNVLRITMMTLRRKLGDFEMIETVTGVGYRMADAERVP
jgi:DNA-binding response OmpR family regulator